MNIRNLSILTLTLLSLGSTGCSGMRGCLFGRGAGCGLCSRIGSVGQAINPFSSPGAAPRCGLTTPPVYAPPAYAPQVHAPTYQPQAYAPSAPCTSPVYGGGYEGTCGTDGAYAVGMPDSGCHSCENGFYGGNVVDPYLHGPTYGGNVIQDGSMYGQPTYGQPNYGMPGDNFQARKVDADGNVIIREDPLPPGAQFVN